jgi:hypothetical protein
MKFFQRLKINGICVSELLYSHGRSAEKSCSDEQVRSNKKKVKQSLYTPWRRLGGEEV